METYNKIKLFVVLLFFVYLLTGCATTKPVVPWPNFELIEIGDMLCALTEADKIKFDRWLERMDRYLRETGAIL